MAKRSRIEYEEDIYQAWAIYCCDCGEFICHERDKPEHHSFTCPDGCEGNEA